MTPDRSALIPIPRPAKTLEGRCSEHDAWKNRREKDTDGGHDEGPSAKHFRFCMLPARCRHVWLVRLPVQEVKLGAYGAGANGPDGAAAAISQDVEAGHRGTGRDTRAAILKRPASLLRVPALARCRGRSFQTMGRRCCRELVVLEGRTLLDYRRALLEGMMLRIQLLSSRIDTDRRHCRSKVHQVFHLTFPKPLSKAPARDAACSCSTRSILSRDRGEDSWILVVPLRSGAY